jgi:5,10-methylenetetrahydromethanopterin reductase
MTRREISIAFQTDKSAAQYIALAQLVNEYDFDAVSVYCDLPFHPAYAPLLLMAPHIKQARIGPAAVPPARIHPLDIAAQTALLSEIAPGRVYIGLARGAWLADHAVPERIPAVRAMREAVDIIRYVLLGRTGGYAGQTYDLADHVRPTYPLPNDPVPIMIGTWGQKMGQLAGEIADELKIGGSANPDMIPVIQSYVAAGERIAGRENGTVNLVIGAVSVIDDDRQQARHMARRALALYLPVVAPLDPTLHVESELINRLRTRVDQGDTDDAVTLISDDLLDRFAFSGDAGDIIEHANRLFEAGAQRIEFGTPHGLQSETGIHILGRNVIPELRRHWT